MYIMCVHETLCLCNRVKWKMLQCCGYYLIKELLDLMYFISVIYLWISPWEHALYKCDTFSLRHNCEQQRHHFLISLDWIDK